MAESNFYKNVSKIAADTERKGLFKKAAQLWINCSFAAVLEKNRQYATRRSEFCLKQLEALHRSELEAEEECHD